MKPLGIQKSIVVTVFVAQVLFAGSPNIDQEHSRFKQLQGETIESDQAREGSSGKLGNATPFSTGEELGASLELQFRTVDGGGAWATGDGGLSLFSSIGQPDANEQMTGGGYSLYGGFLPARRLCELFCDGFESGDTTEWTSTTP